MTLHVCVLGIDGSGKSTISAALPGILAAEMGLLAGAAGEEFRVVSPQEDHLAPRFRPDGLPLSARLAARLKKAAKRLVDHRSLYPAAKLSQLVLQDHAAATLGWRYRARVVVSDGNALLSATGRAANYLSAASDGGRGAPSPEAEDLEAVFSYILDGQPVPPESRRRLPRLGGARLLHRLAARLGLRAACLPDVVVFLDLLPGTAFERIRSRGHKVDRHENLEDLTQAREMYLKCVEAFRRYRSPEAGFRIPVDGLSPGEISAAIVEALRPRIAAQRERANDEGGDPLGTSRRTGSEMKQTALDRRYIFRYLLAKWFRGAWREPTFLLSPLGRLFLEEGYSAGVMRAIYDRDEKRYGPLDRAFLEYPLHRAVYDRLHILTRRVEAELESRLLAGREVRIFTAPSGFAYDLFRPLEAIASRRPDLMRRVHLVAADLDPHRSLAGELAARAGKLGIRFEFLRGDMTEGGMREKFAASAPFDVILFVGLSAWLPKPGVLDHLLWIRKNLREDGVLVTDSFTAETYALSGRYVGYRANYYEPEVYRTLVDHCGFDGLGAEVESGRDGINHVLVATLR
jgi:SAM-dependent methyltransferase/energy-coupling factor transporter ATP-binding protein EcfA2